MIDMSPTATRATRRRLAALARYRGSYGPRSNTQWFYIEPSALDVAQ